MRETIKSCDLSTFEELMKEEEKVLAPVCEKSISSEDFADKHPRYAEKVETFQKNREKAGISP